MKLITKCMNMSIIISLIKKKSENTADEFFIIKYYSIVYVVIYFIIGVSEFNYKTEDQIFGKHTFVYISMQAKIFPSDCTYHCCELRGALKSQSLIIFKVFQWKCKMLYSSK